MKFLYHKYKDLLLIFVLSLVPTLWYGWGAKKFIAGIDSAYPFNPTEFIKNGLYLWIDNDGFGHDVLSYMGNILPHLQAALLTHITGSINLGQELYLIIWFLMPMLVMYLAVKKISALGQLPYVALIAAVLFQFNIFQFEGWLGIWQTRFSTYAALPLLLLILIDYFEGRRKIIRSSLLIGLVIFFFNGGGSTPLFGSLILLIVITALFYTLLDLFSSTLSLITIIRTVLFLLISAAITFVLSLFWTLPLSYMVHSSYQAIIASVGGPAAGIAWIDEVTRNASVLNLLRLQGLDIIEKTSALDFIKNLVTNPLLISASFLWPFLAFLPLLLIKEARQKRYFLLLSFLAIAGLVFTAGSHEPFRQFYIFLLKNVPGFPIFRTPIYKFSSLLWFAYSILLAFSLGMIIDKTKNAFAIKKNKVTKIPMILSTVFLVFVLVWNYPFFTNRYFYYSPVLTMLIRVPAYVFDYAKWINGQNQIKEKILLLPELNPEWHAESFHWGYWSASTVTSTLSRKNYVSNDGALLRNESQLVQELYQAIKDNNQIWPKFASFLNIKYFLLRGDFFSEMFGSGATTPAVYAKILSSNNNLEKIKSFGAWDLYELKNEITAKIFVSTLNLFSALKDEEIANIFPLVVKENDKVQGLTFIPINKDRLYKDKVDNLIIVPGPISYLLPVEKQKLLITKPRFMPGSLFYSFTESQEKEMVQKAKNNEDLFNIYLELTLKRLGEIDTLINTYADMQNIEDVLNRYSILLGEINKAYRSLLIEKKVDQMISNHSSFVLTEERNFLASLINSQTNPLEKKMLSDMYRSIGDLNRSLGQQKDKDIPQSDFEKAYYDPSIVLLGSDYKWTVPKTGNYDVYINNASILVNSKELTINIDGKIANSDLGQAENNNSSGWQKVGGVELTEGEHGLKITADGIPIYSFKKGDIVFYSKQTTSSPSISLRVSSKQKTEINYTKLNPTRYKVEVASDGKPFTLVFNERFDPDWKVYLRPSSKLKAQSSKVIDKIWQVLDENIFNTLRLRPLAEENHFKVNGYANAWYVDSKQLTVNSKQRYDIIIEYWPQRLLCVGYAVSIVTVLGSIIYLVVSRKKE